jgi:magnesium transporter
MITYGRGTEKGLVETDGVVEGCWIDAADPTPEEASRLSEELGIPRDFVADALDPGQVSLIEKEGGLLLVLVHVPYFDGTATKPPYLTAPVGIAVGDHWVATICRIEHELLRQLPHERERELDTTEPTRLLLVALWSVANMYLRRLGEIDAIVERLEGRLQGSLRNREVLELLRYQKSLVHFTNSLRGNELILESLRQGDLVSMAEPEQRLLDDVIIEHRQAIGRVEVAGTILSNMMDAFASIISNNLNTVMKFLTSMTIVLIIPTVLATFYGMNVPVPFQHDPWAFAGIVALSLLCALIVALIFWKKDWL